MSWRRFQYNPPHPGQIEKRHKQAGRNDRPRVASDHGPVLVRCKQANLTDVVSASKTCGRDSRGSWNWCVDTEASQRMWWVSLTFKSSWQGSERPLRDGIRKSSATTMLISEWLRRRWPWHSLHQQIYSRVYPPPQNGRGLSMTKSNPEMALGWDRNTKFYHSWVKQKMTRLHIHSVEVDDRVITEEEELRASAVDFFQGLLTSSSLPLSEPTLDLIHQLPLEAGIEELTISPIAEEVKKAVFDISGNSAPGPDGFSTTFFKKCWTIVGVDVTFFGGAYLPRSITATLIILIPNKEAP